MLSSEQQDTLKIQDNISTLKKREERYMYYGIYEQYRMNTSKMQKLEYSKLNPTQHFMFKRILHGLKMYKKEEIASMHKQKRGRIIKVWKKGQNVINEWKQQISNKRCNTFLEITFGTRSSLVRDIVSVPYTEILPDHINKTSLKDLGINYEDLILRFMTVGLLPKNFLEIK
tara:strand:+ start:2429 stop:2944 length:516 start_codon:yes stop_codon:yes gene_type:complete